MAVVAVLFVAINLPIDMLHRHRSFHQEISKVIIWGLFLLVLATVVEIGAVVGAQRRDRR